jgi:hypothetical protein
MNLMIARFKMMQEPLQVNGSARSGCCKDKAHD